MCSSRVPARAVPHVLPTSVEVDGHRNTRGFRERQQALQGGRGEVLVKPRTLILKCKFIPAAVYWQKEGKFAASRNNSCPSLPELCQRRFCMENFPWGSCAVSAQHRNHISVSEVFYLPFKDSEVS